MTALPSLEGILYTEIAICYPVSLAYDRIGASGGDDKVGDTNLSSTEESEKSRKDLKLAQEVSPLDLGKQAARSTWPIVTVVCFGGAILGAWGLFLLAGIDLFSWVPLKLGKAPKPLPEQTRGNVVTAAVTLVAGLVGLWTYLMTHRQKERHLEKQLEKDREIAFKQREQQQEFESIREKRERDFEKAKERRERDLAELQRLETQFGQLAEDFAEPSVLERINAAIGMGELARTPDPRREGPNGEAPKAPDGEFLSAKCAENYPYFLRAANRLAAALHQWNEQPARDEARRALRAMASFAKDEGTYEPLLHSLVNILAEANRISGSVFEEVLAEGIALGDRKILIILARFCEFFESDRENSRCLNRIRKSKKCIQALERSRELKFDVDSSHPTSVNGLYLLKFRNSAKTLLGSQQALTAAARALSAPPELPPEIENWYGQEGNEYISTWQRSFVSIARKKELNLQDCFLQGADFSWTHMQTANFEGAKMQGSNFCGTQMQAANFRDSQLQEADLTVAHIQCGIFIGAKMQKALFSGAHIQAADFNGASMQSANFSESLAQTADFFNANMKNAQCSGAMMQGTRFHGTQMQSSNFYNAHMEGSNFDYADMSNAMFYNAHLQSADFLSVQANETRFAGAELQKSNFHGANLQSADFRHSQLQGADFSKIYCLKGAQFFGAQCYKYNGEDPTVFSPNAIYEADFISNRGDEREVSVGDFELRDWIARTYPKNT